MAKKKTTKRKTTKRKTTKRKTTKRKTGLSARIRANKVPPKIKLTKQNGREKPKVKPHPHNIMATIYCKHCRRNHTVNIHRHHGAGSYRRVRGGN